MKTSKRKSKIKQTSTNRYFLNPLSITVRKEKETPLKLKCSAGAYCYRRGHAYRALRGI
jgi:hypothetical protein